MLQAFALLQRLLREGAPYPGQAGQGQLLVPPPGLRYNTWWLIEGVWWLIGSAPDCHSAVPGSNPASPNLQEHVSSFLGSQQGWHSNCRLASEGWRQRHKNTKNTKKRRKQIFISNFWITIPGSCTISRYHNPEV